MPEGGLVLKLRYQKTLVDGRLRENMSVEVAGGRVLRVVEEAGPAEEGLLLPGLIDLHIHGMLGVDTMQGCQAVQAMAAALPRYGVTAFLPTTMNDEAGRIRQALSGVARAMDLPSGGAQILGAHLEGPFFAKDHLGAQDAGCCLAPSMDNYLRIAEGLEGTVKLLSLSPELPGAEALTAYLVSKGVAVSAGHTGATLEQMERAQASGLRQVTHLFNGMNGLHHRAPGVPGAGLALDGLTCQLIADGIHLHPAILKLCLRAKGAAGLCLITDAMAACGMPDGQYRLGPTDVTVRDGVARIAAGNLAGSTLTLDRALRNMVQLAGASLEEAARMASQTPADALGLEELGRIAPGAVASFAVFDGALRVQKTYVAGCLRYDGARA